MHFAVQRAPNAAADATVQAEALMNLTDGAALSGLSETERSQVVNFRIP